MTYDPLSVVTLCLFDQRFDSWHWRCLLPASGKHRIQSHYSAEGTTPLFNLTPNVYWLCMKIIALSRLRQQYGVTLLVIDEKKTQPTLV